MALCHIARSWLLNHYAAPHPEPPARHSAGNVILAPPPGPPGREGGEWGPGGCIPYTTSRNGASMSLVALRTGVREDGHHRDEASESHPVPAVASAGRRSKIEQSRPSRISWVCSQLSSEWRATTTTPPSPWRTMLCLGPLRVQKDRGRVPGRQQRPSLASLSLAAMQETKSRRYNCQGERGGDDGGDGQVKSSVWAFWPGGGGCVSDEAECRGGGNILSSRWWHRLVGDDQDDETEQGWTGG
ncbi:hypothetical protein LZ30DRAFT_121578 [Colletotrichum cereale]|nr:hypothetical protein LZ30DRAFT_121578 [Colletotrichum cereale]